MGYVLFDTSGDLNSKKPEGKEGVNSASRPSVRADRCLFREAVSKKRSGKGILSSDVPTKQIAGTGAPSAKGDEVVFFKDVKLGPHQGELRFRLIHFWEARNALTKVLFGLEMLLIDEEGTAIQGFIPPERIDTYLPHMIAGSIYRLKNFYVSKSKIGYRVADPVVVITFSWNSASPISMTVQLCFRRQVRFYRYEEFEAACELKGDLYDYVGHMKLVNGQTLSDSLVLDEGEIASKRHILWSVMKLYLWDKAAVDFCKKFKAYENTPSVILVTTLNPKRLGGALSLCSLSSSRVFFDLDVQPTRDYLTWLGLNSDVANRVNADIVTKAETATIGELFSYMKQEGAKVAWFECTATIDDVVRGCAWYYIACGVCKTKATKGPTTLMCKKCGKAEIAGVAEYLMRLSVYDNNDQATFVLLGDAGHELTGRQASELVESYFEANESVGVDHVVPVPQALIDTIGQTHKFVVKVSTYNLTGKTQALTVTKVLPPQAPAPEGDLEENVTVPSAKETSQLGNREDGPSVGNEESADGAVKRSSDGIESAEAKACKYG
ncbi:hypothetical protein Bca101_025187 [Brassica carinata]